MLFLFALYTILPDYFRLINIPSQLFCSLLIILLYFFLPSKSINKTGLKMAFIYFIPYAIVLASHGEAISLIRVFIERVVLFIILASILENKETYSHFVDTLLNLSIVEGVLGIIHFMFDFNFFSLFSNTLDENFIDSNYGAGTQYRLGFPRIEGSFSHAITYGIYVSLIACLCLWRYNNSKKTKYILIYWLMALNLLLTISRMPIIVFVSSQILYLFLLSPAKAFAISLKIFLFSIVILFITYIAFPVIWETLFSMISMVLAVFSDTGLSGISSFNQDSAFSYRAEMLRVVPKLVKDHMLLGIGASQMADFKFLINGSIQRSIDNQYLYFFVLYGIIGIISVILRVFIVLFFDKKKFQTEPLLNRFSTYRNLMIYIYALNLFSVAEMEEYKFVTVLLALAIADINIRKKELQCKSTFVTK